MQSYSPPVSRSVQRRPMYHLPAPTLHIPRMSMHRSLLHNWLKGLVNPPIPVTYIELSTEHRYIIHWNDPQPVCQSSSELHSGSRPHPGRRQSQYSWAHMDPSAHSLAFRGGAEVPRPVYEWPTGIATLKSDASRVGTYRRSLYGRGRMLCNLQVRAIYVVNPEHGG